MTAAFVFTCSICGEPSQSICVFCTKDACANHLCERCRRCSDCCECEVRLEEHPSFEALPAVAEADVPMAAEIDAEAPAPHAGEESQATPELGEAPAAEEPAPREPAPPEPLMEEAAAPPSIEPDLSKLFRPEPETPPAPAGPVPLFRPEPGDVSFPATEPPPAPATATPDLSRLFAPEPGDLPPPPVAPETPASSEPDLSKLFAPEPEERQAGGGVFSRNLSFESPLDPRDDAADGEADETEGSQEDNEEERR